MAFDSFSSEGWPCSEEVVVDCCGPCSNGWAEACGMEKRNVVGVICVVVVGVKHILWRNSGTP